MSQSSVGESLRCSRSSRVSAFVAMVRVYAHSPHGNPSVAKFGLENRTLPREPHSANSKDERHPPNRTLILVLRLPVGRERVPGSGQVAVLDSFATDDAQYRVVMARAGG